MCNIFAYPIHFFVLGGYIWTACIAFSFTNLIGKENWRHLQKYFPLFYTISMGIPLLGKKKKIDLKIKKINKK